MSRGEACGGVGGGGNAPTSPCSAWFARAPLPAHPALPPDWPPGLPPCSPTHRFLPLLNFSSSSSLAALLDFTFWLLLSHTPPLTTPLRSTSSV